MAQSVLRRIYRARPLASILMSLPGVVLVLWYAWSAFSRVAAYRRAVSEEGPLALETLHIALHDQLESDVRRMLMPPPPDPSRLPTYRLRLQREAVGTLLDSAESTGDRPYVDGKVEHDGRLLDAEVRVRGDRHWHTLGAQKSLKVKLEKGELIDGHRIFNLINDPTSMVVGQQLILDLARESGLLTPVSKFARVKINSKDFGVYRYETAADESLLRAESRVPGSIYSSELPSSAATEELWSKTQFWTKVSSRTDAEADQSDFTDLSRLLHHVHSASAREFSDFARHELDLEAFARLNALDVAFGADQRDFRKNHTFHFDPYRGRWAPIAGEFRGFRNDPAFNIVDNPVLLRLAMHPGYSSSRDRLLYEFLMGEGRPSAVHARAKRLLTELAADLRADPYWDAYRQLPRVDTFHRRMIRPNTLSRLALVVESELVTYGHRHAQLVAELEKNPLYVALGAPEPRNTEHATGAAPEFVTRLSLFIDGHAGVALNEVGVSFDEHCSDTRVQVAKAGVQLPARSREGLVELTRELLLYPSVGLVPRADADPRRGDVRGTEQPIVYPLELISRCPPERVLVRGRHLATDSRVVGRPASAALLARVPRERLSPDETPRLAAGEVAPHPWELEAPSARETTLGPGDVTIATTRVFEPHETVTVRAGTRLLLAGGASLVFLGRVTFDGHRHDRIEISRLSAEAFGGVVIQGPRTAESRLSHVDILGGARPSWRSVTYPAMIDVHDTRDVRIEGCRFGRNEDGTDTLHVAYVTGLDVSDTSFFKVPADAFDLEFSTAKLRRVRINGSGDDGLDLMGSRVELRDSILLGARGNALSSGEESVANVQGTLIGTSKIGVLAKNAARVSLSGSVLFKNGVGVRTYRRTVRYAGESEVTADVLFVAESQEDAVKRDDRERDGLDRGRVLLDLPRRGVVDHVLENVLELTDWQELPRWIGDQKEQAIR